METPQGHKHMIKYCVHMFNIKMMVLGCKFSTVPNFLLIIFNVSKSTFDICATVAVKAPQKCLNFIHRRFIFNITSLCTQFQYFLNLSHFNHTMSLNVRLSRQVCDLISRRFSDRPRNSTRPSYTCHIRGTFSLPVPSCRI